MKRRAGFTLLELLTVLAVLSVVTTIGTGAFFSVTSKWNSSASRMALHDRAGHALESIRRDVELLTPARLSGVPLHGETGTVRQDSLFWRVPLENDRLVLPVEDVDPATGLRQSILVMYHVDRSGAVPRLMRRMGDLRAGEPAGAETEVASGVIGFRCRYLSGGVWQGTWNAAALPEAVEVNVVLMDPERPYEQIARKAGFGVRVR